MFELIKETQYKHPVLCSKALQALLDILQGQQPEGLKSEPSDVIGKYHINLFQTKFNDLINFILFFIFFFQIQYLIYS